MKDWGRRLTSGAGALLFVSYVSASLLWRGQPRPIDLKERLASLPLGDAPLRDEVRIYWNDHHIPFIEAQHDTDLAVGLGIVHAHLRLTQIDFMRRIALGRLAEVAGPMAVSIDHALRTLDFVRAGAEVDKVLPPRSREWMEGFRTGLNFHVDHLKSLPHEFQVLGIRPERWNFSDLLAVSRLASLDFTWKVWMRLLKLRRHPEWTEIWEQLVTEPTIQPPSVAGYDEAFESIIGAHARSGSNSYAVASSRTASGGAMIANDPHLSISLPNNWLVLGLKSPSYHAVGMMVPGVPVLGLGRNPSIAWGGTSLHGASSELVDVSGIPRDTITTRRTTIRVRWGRNRTARIRESGFGPIISDVPLLRMARQTPIALHWMGHRPSDEVTPFLKILEAKSWKDFHSALEGYAIPGLNMIYADRNGHIGQAIAATLPRRTHIPPSDIVTSSEALDHWESFVSSRDLPHSHDPPEGFVASANNAPPSSEVTLSLFFSPDDRVRRLREVLSGSKGIEVADLARLQTDVVSLSARELSDKFWQVSADHLADGRTAREEALLQALREWDGAYHAQSRGALAFELLTFQLVRRLHGGAGAALYAASWDYFSLLRRDLERNAGEALRRPLRRALAEAARSFEQLGDWGSAHRLRLAHAFAFLPRLGRRFIFADRPASGSNETLMKTAHGLSGERHRVRFGADSRHISELSDPDANYFVLLGGQDGWLGSTTFLDQLKLWDRGTHIRVPLNLESVRAEFAHVTILRPRVRQQET